MSTKLPSAGVPVSAIKKLLREKCNVGQKFTNGEDTCILNTNPTIWKEVHDITHPPVRNYIYSNVIPYLNGALVVMGVDPAELVLLPETGDSGDKDTSGKVSVESVSRPDLGPNKMTGWDDNVIANSKTSALQAKLMLAVDAMGQVLGKDTSDALKTELDKASEKVSNVIESGKETIANAKDTVSRLKNKGKDLFDIEQEEEMETEQSQLQQQTLASNEQMLAAEKGKIKALGEQLKKYITGWLSEHVDGDGCGCKKITQNCAKGQWYVSDRCDLYAEQSIDYCYNYINAALGFTTAKQKNVQSSLGEMLGGMQAQIKNNELLNKTKEKIDMIKSKAAQKDLYVEQAKSFAEKKIYEFIGIPK